MLSAPIEVVGSCRRRFIRKPQREKSYYYTQAVIFTTDDKRRICDEFLGYWDRTRLSLGNVFQPRGMTR